jgi:cyanate permease
LMVTLWPGGALGPLFAAWVHDQLGSYDVAFGTFAGLNALVCLSLLGLRQEARARRAF